MGDEICGDLGSGSEELVAIDDVGAVKGRNLGGVVGVGRR